MRKHIQQPPRSADPHVGHYYTNPWPTHPHTWKNKCTWDMRENKMKLYPWHYQITSKSRNSVFLWVCVCVDVWRYMHAHVHSCISLLLLIVKTVKTVKTDIYYKWHIHIQINQMNINNTVLNVDRRVKGSSPTGLICHCHLEVLTIVYDWQLPTDSCCIGTIYLMVMSLFNCIYSDCNYESGILEQTRTCVTAWCLSLTLGQPFQQQIRFCYT